MGSALYLSGGVQSTDRLVKTISQAHTFKIGDVLRFDVASGQYTKAQANSAFNSEVVGVVSAISPVNFTLTISGQIDDLNSVSYLAGITSPVLFLSGSTAGQVTPNPPSAIGSVIKPILIRNQTTQTYVVNNFLGTQIGGSSTVSIDEIQPVGTIMPYAGSVIPETWLACNGNSYALASYPELFSKCTYQTGEQTPLYGHVVQMQFSSGSATWHGSVQVGDYVIINQAAVTPTTAAYDLIGIVLNKTAPLLSGSLGLTVQIIPKYSTTTKTFSIANKRVVGTSAVVAYAEVGLTTIRGAAGSQAGTVNTVTITHFNVPDLRGRFPLGVNTTALGEMESDITNYSGISGVYSLGAEGGEEYHRLTIGELPTHTHSAPTTNGVAAAAGTGFELGGWNGTAVVSSTGYDYGARAAPTEATGSNELHNNMPPYTAFQYIIKAKPYTRAALIDGVDLPYERLLIRDTNANSLETELLSGFSGGDLVFYTSSGETTKLGTERMRLKNSGNLAIGTATDVARLVVKGVGTNDSTPEIRLHDSSDSKFVDLNASVGSGNWNPLNQDGTSSIVYGVLSGGNIGVTLSIVPWSSAANSGMVLSSTSTTTRVGINNKGRPYSGLSVVGEIFSDYDDTITVGGALRIATNVNESFVGSNQYYDTSYKFARAGGSGRLRFDTQNNSVGGSVQILTGKTGAAGAAITETVLMHLGSNNKVGIGSNHVTPQATLHVRDSATPASETTLAGMNSLSKFTMVLDLVTALGSGSTPTFNGGLAFAATTTISSVPLAAIMYSGQGGGGGLHVATSTTYANGLSTNAAVGLSVWNGKVGINNTLNPAVALDINGEARSSTSTTAASNAKTLVTKDYVDSKAFTFTYGNTTYSTTGWTNIVGAFNNNHNYFDVFPPAGKAMSDLIAFIPSIAVVHYAGGVDGNDSIRCTWVAYADRIRVWVQNTEQRSTPAANWLAVWR